MLDVLGFIFHLLILIFTILNILLVVFFIVGFLYINIWFFTHKPKRFYFDFMRSMYYDSFFRDGHLYIMIKSIKGFIVPVYKNISTKIIKWFQARIHPNISLRNLILVVLVLCFTILPEIIFFNSISFSDDNRMNFIKFYTYQFLRCQFYSFIIVLTPLSDIVLKFIYGVRSKLTNKEKELIYYIFLDVYESMLSKGQIYSQNIKLYIDESTDVNAYAMGSNTVVVTRGMIYNLSEEEKKGILAHELGHIRNGDTIVPLILTACSGFGFLVRVVVRLLYLISKNNRFMTAITNFVYGLYMFFTAIFQIIIVTHNRKSEYHADRFAMKCGFFEGLTSALYKLSEMDIASNDKSISARIYASHPNINLIIAKLEELSK